MLFRSLKISEGKYVSIVGWLYIITQLWLHLQTQVTSHGFFSRNFLHLFLCCSPQAPPTSLLGSVVVNLGYTAYVGNSTSPTGIFINSVMFFWRNSLCPVSVGDLTSHVPKAIDETPPRNGDVGIIDARNWGPPFI